MKKGFTLIELLAVIVVLAIIALIATPMILNVVEKARKGAAVSSAYGYIDAVEKYIVMHNIDSTKYPYELNNNTLNVSKANNDTPALNTIINVKGKKPESGTVTINEKGNVQNSKLVINNYVIECSNKKCTVKGKLVSAKSLNIVDKSVTDVYINSTLNLAVKVDPKDAVVEWTSSDESVATVEDGVVTGKKAGTVTITVTSGSLTDSITLNVGYKVYKNGTAVYYNPETNTKCSESEAVSTTGTKTGCMKWYTFNDSLSSTTVNMILDHNTTTATPWNTNNSNSSIGSAGTVLANDVSTWNGNLNPRLIEANEIAKITNNASWNSINNDASWFYFDSNNQTKVASSTNKSDYAWLFDYTSGCTNYGCNIADSSTIGYWTKTAKSNSSSDVWVVSNGGRLYTSGADYMNYGRYNTYGIRPVITISKEALE